MIPAASKWWAESNVRLKTSDVESVFKLKACCLKRIIAFFFLCFNTLHKKAHTNTHTNGSEVKIERGMGLNQSQRHKMDESQFFWTESQLLLRSLCEEHVVQNDQTECKKLQSQCLLTYCVRFSRHVSAHSCIHVCWWLESRQHKPSERPWPSRPPSAQKQSFASILCCERCKLHAEQVPKSENTSTYFHLNSSHMPSQSPALYGDLSPHRRSLCDSVKKKRKPTPAPDKLWKIISGPAGIM